MCMDILGLPAALQELIEALGICPRWATHCRTICILLARADPAVGNRIAAATQDLQGKN